MTAPSNRGAYYDADLRTVTRDGVAHVMRLFFRHFAGDDARTSTGSRDPDREETQRAREALERAREAVDIICEENALDSGAGEMQP